MGNFSSFMGNDPLHLILKNNEWFSCELAILLLLSLIHSVFFILTLSSLFFHSQTIWVWGELSKVYFDFSSVCRVGKLTTKRLIISTCSFLSINNTQLNPIHSMMILKCHDTFSSLDSKLVHPCGRKVLVASFATFFRS